MTFEASSSRNIDWYITLANILSASKINLRGDFNNNDSNVYLDTLHALISALSYMHCLHALSIIANYLRKSGKSTKTPTIETQAGDLAL